MLLGSARTVLVVFVCVVCATRQTTGWSMTVLSRSCVHRPVRMIQRHDENGSPSEIPSSIGSGRNAGLLSRAQVLRAAVPAGLAAAAAVVIGNARPSSAALPTPDDYAFGAGSKIKRGSEIDISARPLPNVNRNNVVEVVGALPGELDYVKTLIEKERWGDAMARLKTFPLTAMKSPTLGLGSVGEVARTLGITNAKASEMLEASVEAGLTLREVEDIVFSNTRTLQFFNDVDLKQVENMALKAKPADKEEPLQLLSDTKGMVDSLKAIMMAEPP